MDATSVFAGQINSLLTLSDPGTHKAVETLFDLQMYLFGCDVRRKAGNLLVRYGFRRHRGHIADQGATRYSLNRNGCRLQLWGSAFLLADRSRGAVAIKRDRFQILYSADLSIYRRGITLDRLGSFQSVTPRAIISQVLARMTHWLANYESWVHKVTEPGYRETCVDEHLKRPRVGIVPEMLPALWSRVASLDWAAFQTDFERALITAGTKEPH